MNENCKECPYIKNLDKEVMGVKEEVTSLTNRINNIEKETAINQEQTKMVFKILNEIKESIEKIGNKIDEIEARPNKLLYTIAGGIIVSIILAWIKAVNL